jgi:hypothetical protein
MEVNLECDSAYSDEIGSIMQLHATPNSFPYDRIQWKLFGQYFTKIAPLQFRSLQTAERVNLIIANEASSRSS